MKAIVCGANGAMGQLILAALGGDAYKVSLDGMNGVPKTFEELGKVDADVIIDFSHHSAVADVLNYAKAHNMAVVVGIHEVHICTPSQTLVLRHEAANRAMFADGAVAAAKFLVGKSAGHYNMTHFLEG